MSCDRIINTHSYIHARTHTTSLSIYQLCCHCNWKGKRNVFRFDWLKLACDILHHSIPFHSIASKKHFNWFVMCDVRKSMRHFYLCHTWAHGISMKVPLWHTLNPHKHIHFIIIWVKEPSSFFDSWHMRIMHSAHLQLNFMRARMISYHFRKSEKHRIEFFAKHLTSYKCFVLEPYHIVLSLIQFLTYFVCLLACFMRIDFSVT